MPLVAVNKIADSEERHERHDERVQLQQQLAEEQAADPEGPAHSTAPAAFARGREGMSRRRGRQRGCGEHHFAAVSAKEVLANLNAGSGNADMRPEPDEEREGVVLPDPAGRKQRNLVLAHRSRSAAGQRVEGPQLLLASRHAALAKRPCCHHYNTLLAYD
jgi:hypothetical protein